MWEQNSDAALGSAAWASDGRGAQGRSRRESHLPRGRVSVKPVRFLKKDDPASVQPPSYQGALASSLISVRGDELARVP